MVEQRFDKVLVIGFGNPGRRDDGLGPALVAMLEAEDLPGVALDADYQLTVEDAAEVAAHDAVVFVDASCNGAEPMEFQQLQPRSADATSFSTHSVKPEGVLALAESLFGSAAPGFMLGIRGYEFNEFGEGLSDRAAANLAAARDFLLPVLRKRSFWDAVPVAGGEPAVTGPQTGDI